jgi:hypothetical protein
MRHELTPEHARNVSDYESWHPPADHSGWEASEDRRLTVEELKVREKQTRVDHVRHMVPWWVRAVEAAGRGEEMRMEEFLDTINKGDGWGPDGLIWGDEWGVVPDAVNGNDWANDTWGAAGDGGEWSKPAADWAMSGSASSLNARRTPTASSLGARRRHNHAKRKGKTRDVDIDGRHHDSYRFVEEIAKQEAADAERKRRMHKFFKVCSIFSRCYPLISCPDAYARKSEENRRSHSSSPYWPRMMIDVTCVPVSGVLVQSLCFSPH